MESPIIPNEVLAKLKAAFEANDPTADDGAPGRISRLMKIAELTGECMDLCEGDDTLLHFVIIASMTAYIDHKYCDEAGLDEDAAMAEILLIAENTMGSIANLNEIVRIPPPEEETKQQLYYRAYRDGLAAYAFDKNGTMKIGNPAITLKEALAKAEDTWNYKPELDKVEDAEEDS